MMKTNKLNHSEKLIEDCRTDIKKILNQGLKFARLTQQEVEEAKSFDSWFQLQPLLDRAQGEPQTTTNDLKQWRSEHPLERESFIPRRTTKVKSVSAGGV